MKPERPPIQTRSATSNLVPANRLARRSTDGWKRAAPYPMGRYVRRVFRFLVECMMPPPPAPNSKELVDEVENVVRSWMPYMLPLSARGLSLSILLLDFAPIFLFVAPRRLHKMRPERASALLSEMVHGRFAFLRLLVVALRGVVMSAYFDQEEVHRAIAYRPVAFMRERIALRAGLLEEEPSRLSLQPPLPKQTESVPPPAQGAAP